MKLPGLEIKFGQVVLVISVSTTDVKPGGTSMLVRIDTSRDEVRFWSSSLFEARGLRLGERNALDASGPKLLSDPRPSVEIWTCGVHDASGPTDVLAVVRLCPPRATGGGEFALGRCGRDIKPLVLSVRKVLEVGVRVPLERLPVVAIVTVSTTTTLIVEMDV